MANGLITVIVVLYLLFMLFIGWYSSKRISNNTDFMVAGRRLGPILMAGTLAATEIGGGSSLGVVQQGMQNHGISASWYIITMGLAFIILTFMAPKFRASEVKTVPEFFRRRYGKGAGIITAIIMLIPLVGLTEGQFVASATILSTMLGIGYKPAIIIVAAVVICYSVMGGLWSVTMTDFIQVFLIVFGMVIAVPFALGEAGGWANVVANVPPETFNMFKGYSPMAVLSLTIMYVATFTVGQEAVSRYYAARDGKAAVQGSILAAIVNFIFAFIPAILGIITLRRRTLCAACPGGPHHAGPNLRSSVCGHHLRDDVLLRLRPSRCWIHLCKRYLQSSHQARSFQQGSHARYPDRHGHLRYHRNGSCTLQHHKHHQDLDLLLHSPCCRYILPIRSRTLLEEGF